MWFAGRMAALIDTPDDDEPSDEDAGETPDELGLAVSVPAHGSGSRRGVRISVLDDDSQPVSINGLNGVLSAGIFSNELMRSLSASLSQHWLTPQMKESLAQISAGVISLSASHAQKLGSFGLFDDATFQPLVDAQTQDMRRIVSATMGAIPSLTSANMPGLNGLANLTRFQTGFMTSEYIQSLVPKIALPEFSGLLSMPSILQGLNVDGLIRSLRTRHAPPNWLDVELDPQAAEADVRGVLDDGIPLGWVPSAAIVQRLLDAPDQAGRRRVISNNWRGILNDCDAVAEGLPSPSAFFLADMIRAAIRAIRDGHAEAGQALATNVLDTTVSQFTVAELSINKGVILNPDRKEWLVGHGWRIALSLLAVQATMAGKFGLDHRGSAFHRNVTSHAATRRQYNRINAVIAVMLATSTLACYVRDTSAFD